MKRRIIQSISVLATWILCCVLFASPAQATLLNESAYSQYVYSQANKGGQFTLNLGQESLSTGSTSSSQPSINKEMWLYISDGVGVGSCWLEAGSKKGAVLKDLSQDEDTGQSIYWAGHFLGYRLWDTGVNAFKFHATPYGSYGPTGQQTYQVKLTNPSNGTWTYYVNGTQALTLTGARCRNNFNGTVFYVTKSDALYTGIENKDDSNSFTNSTRIDNWQWLNISTGLWKLVDDRTGNVANGSNPTANNLGYVASFSIATDSSGNIISNKIVFTHP